MPIVPESKEHSKYKLLVSLIFPVIFTVAIWCIKLYEYYNLVSFARWGVYPRTFAGLKGIVSYPLVHGNFDHLINNTAPVFLLSFGVFYFYRKVAINIIVWSWLMSGLWLWCASRPAYHLGASGLIYALGSFLFFSGVISRNKHLLALSLLVVFLYGSMIWGVLPMKPHISWEGHLFGVVAGGILAFYYRKYGPQRKVYDWEDEEDEVEEENEDDNIDGFSDGEDLNSGLPPFRKWPDNSEL